MYTLKLVVAEDDFISSGGNNMLANGVTYTGQSVGTHYDLVAFKGSKGDVLTLTMTNSGNTGVEFSFDNYVLVFNPTTHCWGRGSQHR
jgi:hypothetical protein